MQVGHISVWETLPCSAAVWQFTLRLLWWANHVGAPSTFDSLKCVGDAFLDKVLRKTARSLPRSSSESDGEYEERVAVEEVCFKAGWTSCTAPALCRLETTCAVDAGALVQAQPFPAL